jgi:hypothetical protein
MPPVERYRLAKARITNTRLEPHFIAVDMVDNASALPTCPQRQQRKNTAVQSWSKITHSFA